MKMQSREIFIPFTRLSIAGNTALAIGKLLAGICLQAPFLWASALYSAGMGTAKAIALREHCKSSTAPAKAVAAIPDERRGYAPACNGATCIGGRYERDEQYAPACNGATSIVPGNAAPPAAMEPRHSADKRRAFGLAGLIVLIAGIAYMAYSFGLFANHHTPSYDMNTSIAIAAFTFFELGFSIRGVIGINRHKDITMQAVRLINLASSCILLAVTQSALLSFTRTGEDMSLYNGVSGILFSLVAVIIGLGMMYTGRQSRGSAAIEELPPL